MLEPPKAVATSSHVIMHRITMGNQQATLMTTLSSITSAEFIGCFLVVPPHADSREPSEAIRSPPAPILMEG